MKLPIYFLAVLLLLSATWAKNIYNMTSPQLLNATIRAADCINNATHCHCSEKPPASQCISYKHLDTDAELCTKGTCGLGYQCDCEAHNVCAKLSRVSYQPSGDTTGDLVPCIRTQTEAPRKVVGKTTDLDIKVRGQFQLFVNGIEIGFSQLSVRKIFTAEIASGDRIAIIGKRQDTRIYGIKLKVP